MYRTVCRYIVESTEQSEFKTLEAFVTAVAKVWLWLGIEKKNYYDSIFSIVVRFAAMCGDLQSTKNHRARRKAQCFSIR